jgi:hypothetical protein
MTGYMHGLLLIISVSVPPVILGYLLFLGHAISRDQRARIITTPKPRDNKHPYSLQP